MITCSESSLSSNLHRLQSKHAYAFRQEPYQTLSAASPAFPKRKPPQSTCQSSIQCSSVAFYGVFRSKPQLRRAQSVRQATSIPLLSLLQATALLASVFGDRSVLHDRPRPSCPAVSSPPPSANAPVPYTAVPKPSPLHSNPRCSSQPRQ